MAIVEASILSANYARLGEEVHAAQAAGVEALEIDVMDGQFVPNISFGPGVVKALRPLVDIPIDAHLMIMEPERFLSAFAEAGADRIIVHPEACVHIYKTLQNINKLNVHAGIALNPGTPLSVLDEILPLVDFVQVMTVNPGFGGQQFIPAQLDKIRRLRRILDERHLQVLIAVDGGMDTTTAPLAARAGADIIISGSGIFRGAGSIAANVAALQASLQEAQAAA